MNQKNKTATLYQTVIILGIDFDKKFFGITSQISTKKFIVLVSLRCNKIKFL